MRIETRTSFAISLQQQDDMMVDKLLTSVCVVCKSDPRVGALSHVSRQIDAFRFSCGDWTLELASKHGFVSKLDQIHAKETQRDIAFHIARYSSGVYNAVKYGYDIRVLEWWINTYRPKRVKVIKGDILRELPQHQYTLDCSDPEIFYWLYEHGRHLLLELQMYKCAAADPSFEFAKWCLTQQDAFKCKQPEDVVSFAIDNDQEEFLQWLFEHQLGLYQPEHLDRAISKGQLQTAKWLLEKFPKHYLSDPSAALDTSAFEFDDDHVLEMIQWVLFELDWQEEKAKFAWMDGLMVPIVSAGRINLLQAVQRELIKRWCDGFTNPHVGVLPHIVQQIDGYRFSYAHWTIESASKRGYVSKLAHINQGEPKLGIEMRSVRCCAAIYKAVKYNYDVRVMEWWIKEYRCFPGYGMDIDPRDSLRWAAIQFDDEQCLESIKWVVFEFYWREENVRLTWFGKAVAAAAGAGKLELLQAIESIRMKFLNESDTNELNSDIVKAAAANSHVTILQWIFNERYIHAQQPHYVRKRANAMDVAAAKGHLNAVKWLHESSLFERCTTRALDKATANGHLEVVKWLHENREEGCTIFAMAGAAANGHLEVVEWLHENRTEGCGQYYSSFHPERGHLPVVQFMYLHQKMKYPEYVMWHAKNCFQFDVYKWLYVQIYGDHDFTKWTFSARPPF